MSDTDFENGYQLGIAERKIYIPLKVELMTLVGLEESMEAMRLPLGSKGKTLAEDIALASKLIKNGPDHAKAMRGIVAYTRIQMQVGFMIEFETYRAGVECLSTSSAMHTDLKNMSGPELAEQKQADLPMKYYTRIATISYQALRNMYFARRNHRHPDWQIFCDWIERLPFAQELITVK
jgi:hypothetical protein